MGTFERWLGTGVLAREALGLSAADPRKNCEFLVMLRGAPRLRAADKMLDSGHAERHPAAMRQAFSGDGAGLRPLQRGLFH